jgi:hypothetical protein
MEIKKFVVLMVAFLLIINAAFSIGIGTTTGQNTGQQNQQTQQQNEQSQQAQKQEWKCNMQTMNERIKCFLSLSDEDIKNVNYIPEDCRVKTGEEKARCIETYKLFQTCRPKPSTDKKREECIIPKLNISNSVREEVEKCKNLIPNQRAVCMSKIKDKVLMLVKFRVYNLIYKAQELKSLGVSEDKVVSIIEKIENAKIGLDKATTNKERIDILIKLKNDWQAFANESKAALSK